MTTGDHSTMKASNGRDFERDYALHLKHLKLKGLQPKTIEAYERAVRRIGNRFGGRIDALSEQELNDFIDEDFGLCYLRVPTWAPFGLQFYCNGHSALARSLRREGIDFVQEDNAFLRISDVPQAQSLADCFNPEQRYRRLQRDAHWLCPVAAVFAQDDRHWSLRQAAYSTDLMFRSRDILVPLYDTLSRQAVLAADATRAAGFLGKQITSTLAPEIGPRLSHASRVAASSTAGVRPASRPTTSSPACCGSRPPSTT